MRVKKVFLIGGVAFIVVGIALYITLSTAKTSARYEAPLNTLSADTQSVSAKDSDEDGLLDWEEVLWKTDPNNPDTDRDGTPDGEEVKLNRNPLIKGPDDTLSQEEIDSLESKTLTPTSLLARDILTAHYQLTKGGGAETLDPSYSLEGLLQKNKPSITATRVASTDLKTKGNTPSEIAFYGSQVAAVLNTHLSPTQTNELQILSEALQKEDAEILKKLEARAMAYEEMAQTLTIVSVPSEVTTPHADLVNTLYLMGAVVESLSKMFTDPVTALSGLEAYQRIGIQLSNQLKDLNLYLESKAR